MQKLPHARKEPRQAAAVPPVAQAAVGCGTLEPELVLGHADELVGFVLGHDRRRAGTHHLERIRDRLGRLLSERREERLARSQRQLAGCRRRPHNAKADARLRCSLDRCRRETGVGEEQRIMGAGLFLDVYQDKDFQVANGGGVPSACQADMPVAAQAVLG